jgi:hypothetical protein
MPKSISRHAIAYVGVGIFALCINIIAYNILFMLIRSHQSSGVGAYLIASLVSSYGNLAFTFSAPLTLRRFALAYIGVSLINILVLTLSGSLLNQAGIGAMAGSIIQASLSIVINFVFYSKTARAFMARNQKSQIQDQKSSNLY